MKTRGPYIRTAVTAAIVLLLIACSTKKNTWTTRTYHNMTARYNVLFNARNAFEEGMKNMRQSNTDDYSALLPLFIVSNHENAKGSAAQMDITIEKCRKAIKVHSIKKKPKRDGSRIREEAYRNYYNQEEFNPMISRAWLLLGQAEFHKTDFMGAVGTFTYITRHFSTEKPVVVAATLWKARSYAEMGWLHEAETAVQSINESDVPYNLTTLYASTRADLLLKQKKGIEAIPFLSVAVQNERNKFQRSRFAFVLGQLYVLNGQRKEAAEHFALAAKLAQSYQMQFNANLSALQTEPNASKAIKELQKMARSSNNKNYLDQVFMAEGTQYLHVGKEQQAIEMYQKAIDKSIRNGIEKAVAAITLGDLYYGKRMYVKAHPCYQIAEQILPETHEDYKRVRDLSETLGTLVQHYNTVQLQDSLLYLSTLSEREQRKIIDKQIANLIKAEEEAARRAADSAALQVAQNNTLSNEPFKPVMGGRGRGEWYFYNAQLKTSGAIEFKRVWGSRPLEDNWRISAKSFGSDNSNVNDSTMKSTTGINSSDTVSTDPHDPNYYMAQIPKTVSSKQAANAQIANALLAIADIFENKLKDDALAAATYREFQRRFPDDNRKSDTYYSCYRIFGRTDSTAAQDEMRQRILVEFPSSKYAVMLSQPDYAERTARMLAVQDSLYAATYHAYMHGDFITVGSHYNLMAANYPLSELMPQFTLLDALATGRSGNHTLFRSKLDSMVAHYPAHEATTMARDILALMGQGKVSSTDSNPGSLLDKRSEQQAADSIATAVQKQFSTDLKMPYSVVLLLNPESNIKINQLLYDIAAFNFTRFLVKDFDLNVRTIERQDALVISNMENREAAVWYQRMLQSEQSLAALVSGGTCRCILIADENLKLIGYARTLAEYEQFAHANRLDTEK